MGQHKNLWSRAGLGLIALLTVICLAGAARSAWAAGTGPDGPAPTPQPLQWLPALGPDGPALAIAPAPLPEGAPTQPAETFTSRVFWIILALVVLGSIILMADFPDTH